MRKDQIENAHFLLSGEDNDGVIWKIIFKYYWSPGEIYWKKLSGKDVLLLNAGEYIDHEKFQKFKDKNMNINFIPKVDFSNVEQGIALFEELKFASNQMSNREVRLAKVREKFINWSAPMFWNGDKDYSLLDLMIIFEQSFYELNGDASEAFIKLPIALQQRSLSLASIITSVSFLSGHMDYKFLKDIFHLTLFFDISLSGERYNTLFEKALERERLIAGDGKKTLEEEDLRNKINTFLNHAEQSCMEAELLLENFLENKLLIDLIKFHHETLDGKGFPEQLNTHSLNDIERIVLAATKALPQNVDIFLKQSDKKSILGFLKSNYEIDGVLGRIISYLSTSYETESDETDDEYLEVVGL